MTEKDLRKIIEEAKKEVGQELTPIEDVSREQAGTIIAKYTAAIEPNFIAWLAAAYRRARSPEARYAAATNLEDEIGENHQGMLQEFAAAANALPDRKHFEATRTLVEGMREYVRRMNGLEGTAVMANLENTSQVFIPYLADLTRMRGSKELTYTDAHGEADIEHAEQFLRALKAEREQGYANPKETIESAVQRATDFIIPTLTTQI